MRQLQYIGTELAVATATALALPLAVGEYAVVGDVWVNGQGKVIPAFDLAIWSDSTVNLTAAELFAAIQHPKAKGATNITSVDHTTGHFTLASHGLVTGDGPMLWTDTGGVLPTGIPSTDTYIIVVDANTFQIANSVEDALRGTALPFSDNGSGTITFTGADADRVYWHSAGLLGNADDGAVDLTAQRAYVRRCLNSPRAVAYGVIATFSAADNVSISVSAVLDSP